MYMIASHHGDENGEGTGNFGVEPMQRLHIFSFVQHWIMNCELRLGSLSLASAYIPLDPLVKLRPCPLLWIHTGNLNMAIRICLCLHNAG